MLFRSPQTPNPKPQTPNPKPLSLRSHYKPKILGIFTLNAAKDTETKLRPGHNSLQHSTPNLNQSERGKFIPFVFPNLLVDERDLTNITDLLMGDMSKQPKKMLTRQDADDTIDGLSFAGVSLHGARKTIGRDVLSVGKEGLGLGSAIGESDFGGDNMSFKEYRYPQGSDYKGDNGFVKFIPAFNDKGLSSAMQPTYSDRKKLQNERKVSKIDRLVTKPKER